MQEKENKNKNNQNKIKKWEYKIMSKVTWKPGTFIYPIPAVMVSLRNNGKF